APPPWRRQRWWPPTTPPSTERSPRSWNRASRSTAARCARPGCRSTASGRPGRRTAPPEAGSAVRDSGTQSADLGHDLVGDIKVGIDVLDLVGVLEGLDEPEHLLG